MAPLFTTVHARSCESLALVCNMLPAEKTQSFTCESQCCGAQSGTPCQIDTNRCKENSTKKCSLPRMLVAKNYFADSHCQWHPNKNSKCCRSRQSNPGEWPTEHFALRGISKRPTHLAHKSFRTWILHYQETPQSDTYQIRIPIFKRCVPSNPWK